MKKESKDIYQPPAIEEIDLDESISLSFAMAYTEFPPG
jgi:hypothetical protein